METTGACKARAAVPIMRDKETPLRLRITGFPCFEGFWLQVKRNRINYVANLHNGDPGKQRTHFAVVLPIFSVT